MIITVLGSCVAVCLWDAHEHVGGMNHYLLPRRMEKLASLRFGDVAIDQLVDGMTELGCGIGNLRAKIFGGAELLALGATGDTVGIQMREPHLNGCDVMAFRYCSGCIAIPATSR